MTAPVETPTAVEPRNTFVSECRAAGIDIEPYHGRFYWTGPAARADNVDAFVDVARATTVDLMWDSPLAYPRDSDSTWYEWAQRNPDAFPQECDYCGESLDDEHTHDDE